MEIYGVNTSHAMHFVTSLKQNKGQKTKTSLKLISVDPANSFQILALLQVMHTV